MPVRSSFIRSQFGAGTDIPQSSMCVCDPDLEPCFFQSTANTKIPPSRGRKNDGHIYDERRNQFSQVGVWKSNIYETHLMALTLEEGQKERVLPPSSHSRTYLLPSSNTNPTRLWRNLDRYNPLPPDHSCLSLWFSIILNMDKYVHVGNRTGPVPILNDQTWTICCSTSSSVCYRSSFSCI